MITEDRKKQQELVNASLLVIILFGIFLYGLAAYAAHSFYHVLVACALAGAACYLLARRRTD